MSVLELSTRLISTKVLWLQSFEPMRYDSVINGVLRIWGSSVG